MLAGSWMHMALLQLQALISIGLLLASMSSGSAEKAPSGYGTELIHVDANGGFTREELVHRGVDRSADMLSATDGDDTPTSSSSGTDSVAGVVHKRYLRDYLMTLKIGKPPEPFRAVLDTSSDLVMTKNLCLCDRSTSFTPVKCPVPDNRVTCEESCVYGLCMFKRVFGNAKKDATGFIGRQTLSWSTTKYNNVLPEKEQEKEQEYKDVRIACAIDNDEELVPESAQGIVGLNRGKMSLVQQLSLTSFSYCLSDEQGTRLWLGDDAKKCSATNSKRQTTPLVPVAKGTEHTSVLWANMYYVQLEGISIGDKYRPLPESSFKLRTKENKGVMMLDSGKPLTTLEKGVFEALEELLTEELTAEKKYTKTKKHKQTTCFRPKDAAASSKPPEMVLHFADDKAKMHLPWANYMDKVGRKFCLTIREGAESILGTFHQVNTCMHYDLTKGHGELSFAPDCHKA